MRIQFLFNHVTISLMHPLNTLSSYVFISAQVPLCVDACIVQTQTFFLPPAPHFSCLSSSSVTQCEWPLRQTQSHFRAAVEYAKRKNKRICFFCLTAAHVVWWPQTETETLRSLITRTCFVWHSSDEHYKVFSVCLGAWK